MPTTIIPQTPEIPNATQPELPDLVARSLTIVDPAGRERIRLAAEREGPAVKLFGPSGVVLSEMKVMDNPDSPRDGVIAVLEIANEARDLAAEVYAADDVLYLTLASRASVRLRVALKNDGPPQVEVMDEFGSLPATFQVRDILRGLDSEGLQAVSRSALLLDRARTLKTEIGNVAAIAPGALERYALREELSALLPQLLHAEDLEEAEAKLNSISERFAALQGQTGHSLLPRAEAEARATALVPDGDDPTVREILIEYLQADAGTQADFRAHLKATRGKDGGR